MAGAMVGEAAYLGCWAYMDSNGQENGPFTTAELLHLFRR